MIKEGGSSYKDMHDIIGEYRQGYIIKGSNPFNQKIVGSFIDGHIKKGGSGIHDFHSIIGSIQDGYIQKGKSGIKGLHTIIGSIEGKCSDGETVSALLILAFFELN